VSASGKHAAALGQPEATLPFRGLPLLRVVGTRADTAEAVGRYRQPFALAQQSHDSVDGLVANDAKKALAKFPLFEAGIDCGRLTRASLRPDFDTNPSIGCRGLPPNKRLKLAGGDRSKGSGVLCAGAHELSFNRTARGGESPAA